METAARTPADARHKEQAPVEPMVAGPTINTSTTTTSTTATTGQGETSPGYLQSARETLASLAGTVQNAVGIETPASTLHNLADNTKVRASMPTSETSGAKSGEHIGGVGALPGSNKEAGVARLPAERTSLPSQEYEGAHPGEKCGGVGSLPGHLSESNVALLPDERGTQTGIQTKEGVQESAHAAAHPSSQHPDKQDLKTAAAHPIETAKQRRGSSSSSSSSEAERDPNAPPKRKTTLKNKVAGGMKTAMGKLKKDEELVAEGQAQRGH